MRPEIEKAVSLLQQGRSDALEKALALLQQTVFSFSMKVCGHREDAEDTMQEVLLKSVRYLPKFTSPKALTVWLYTVAKNRCLMSRRRSKFAPKEDLSLDALMPDRQELENLGHSGNATPESVLLHGENSDLLQQAVLKVPPKYRLILVLHDMEEVPAAEIARITGLREGTVRVRLHRARLFVRQELAAAVRPHKRDAKSRPGAKARKGHTRTRSCRQLFAALSDYLDDRLDATTCDELQKHLKDCAPCEAFLASLETTVQQIRAYEARGLDPKVAASLRRNLTEHYRRALHRIRPKATQSTSNHPEVPVASGKR
jgi:RNA polymerase sigma-70 factor (ECF subfamily)